MRQRHVTLAKKDYSCGTMIDYPQFANLKIAIIDKFKALLAS